MTITVRKSLCTDVYALGTYPDDFGDIEESNGPI